MFSRSRKKIVLAIMVSLILLFILTLAVIMIASYRESRRRNSELLQRYVDQYSLEEQMGGQNDPKPDADGRDSRPKPEGGDDPKDKPLDERPDYQLSTFYSVAFAEDRTVLAVYTGDRTIYGEEELIELAGELLSEEKLSGRIENLDYTINVRPDYTLVAFMDTTVSESSLHLLLHNILIVGGISIILLFFISLWLSKWIIRPLEENDRQQKQFISDASHELKTPVAVIGANAEMLYSQLGENEWLANIQYENDRMGGLVKQLLDLSRAENAETSMERVDLSRIVTGEVLAFECFAFDTGKMIQSDIEDGICVMGNQAQLTQLTSILLDNAVRHGTGSEIGIELKHQGHSAVLCAVNDGDEIPAEKLEHLFDRFYQADEARNNEGQHYGLGLSIARAIVDKHGGSISASCRDGKVRFTISIPEK